MARPHHPRFEKEAASACQREDVEAAETSHSCSATREGSCGTPKNKNLAGVKGLCELSRVVFQDDISASCVHVVSRLADEDANSPPPLDMDDSSMSSGGGKSASKLPPVRNRPQGAAGPGAAGPGAAEPVSRLADDVKQVKVFCVNLSSAVAECVSVRPVLVVFFTNTSYLYP